MLIVVVALIRQAVTSSLGVGGLSVTGGMVRITVFLGMLERSTASAGLLEMFSEVVMAGSAGTGVRFVVNASVVASGVAVSRFMRKGLVGF